MTIDEPEVCGCGCTDDLDYMDVFRDDVNPGWLDQVRQGES